MPNQVPTRDAAFGDMLGRVRLDAPDDIEYLATSRAVGWRGAFLTRVRTGAVGSAEGCWSWLSISLPVNGRDMDASEPRSGCLAIGMPYQTLTTRWTSVKESLNLFVNPKLIEGVFHVRYCEHTVLENIGSFATDPVVRLLLQALLAEISSPGPCDPLHGEMIVSIVLGKLGTPRHIPQAINMRQMSDADLRRLRTYVEHNLGSSIHLVSMADHLGISVRHLCRTLKLATGMSPHELVLKMRVARARELLQSTRLTIEEVADAAGFADRSHMATTLKRALAATPLQIRHTRARPR